MITRIEAKELIKKYMAANNPIQTGATLGTIRPNTTFDVYNIPIEYLVPNVMNDRIAMRIREYEEDNNRKLSFENETDIEYIYKTIEDENKSDNQHTLEDLAKKGQEEFGVITCDGIVVSGNRRATLLRKLWQGEATKYNQPCDKFKCLKCIVLDETYTEKEILALETITQMGKDKQVDYNRINLYIKVDNLFRAGYGYKQIKDYMGMKKESDVKDMHDLYKFMCEYLENIGKANHFSLLDGLEDQMIKTSTFFKKLDNKTYDADWEYDDNDVNDFKLVCYDYLRAHYEGKEYRDVLLGKVNKNKGNGVFTNKRIWYKFLTRHNSIIEAHEDKLITENDWKMLGKTQFKSILSAAEHDLKDILQNKNAKDLISAIDQKVDSLETLIDACNELDEEDVEKLQSINKRIYNIFREFKD